VQQLLNELEKKIPACMLTDQRGFQRRLRALTRRSQQSTHWQRAVSRFARDVSWSMQRAQERRDRLRAPVFPEELPISRAREAISECIQQHPVTIVCGETGSGKTTQLPKICLALGRGVRGLIGHTQPRRVAARSVARRIAQELASPIGQVVGYQVRFNERVSEHMHIKLMTDGILLAEIESDRYLERYDTIIIDEAHERSLNIDFLLGYLKQLLPRRPELKLIIASATIDPEQFAAYFGDAPIIDVSGRTYPVEVRYRPVGSEDDWQGILPDVVTELDHEAGYRGDILVFLPSERDIRDTAELLRKQHLENTEILPLYARLDAARQDRVFAPHSRRRIVLATNIAETSITVPNIRYVIDSGYARISRYSYRSKVQRLPIEKISQASAEQRKGRCGRVGPGVCVRLYSQEDFTARAPFTEPEIQRTDLAAVILKMKALGFVDAEAFPFLDAPDRRYLRDGYRLLRELGALDEAGELTRIGRKLARLPIDPRLGRMLLAASAEGCVAEMLVITSALSIDDPRERPLDQREAAREAQRRFEDERSDFIGLLNLWHFYQQQAKQLSQRQLRAVCREHYLSFVRMREWREVHQQLAALVRDLGLGKATGAASHKQIHRALLSGLLSHIGVRTEDRDYLGARNTRFIIAPTSGLAQRGSKWVMAAELVETARLYAHQVARIHPEWVESAGRHLVRRHYFDPYWDACKGRVMAYERVTLYGLTLVPRRRVHYAPIAPAEARAIFIRAALVEGRLWTDAPFLRHNRELLTKLRRLEHKARRLDIIAGEEAIFEFYDQRLAPDICTVQDFEGWRKTAERTHPHRLFFTEDLLLQAETEAISQDAFPDVFALDGQDFPLDYRFEPGQPDDGVTVTIPAAMLRQLHPYRFEWLVPGLLYEKVLALLRTLPKQFRRPLVPLPDYAERCVQNLRPCDQPLIVALSAALKQLAGIEIPPSAWQTTRLSPHLVLRFQVVDREGKVLGTGRDLGGLQSKLASHARRSFLALPWSEFERDNISERDLDDIPEYVESRHNGMSYRAYPALVDTGRTVSLRVIESQQEALLRTREGLRRLFMMGLPREMRYVRKNLHDIQNMCLSYTRVPPSPWPTPSEHKGVPSSDQCDSLKQDLVHFIADQAFLGTKDPIRATAEFMARKANGARALMAIAEEACVGVSCIFTEYRRVKQKCGRFPTLQETDTFSDVDSQLNHLVYRGFLRDIDFTQLGDLLRYLRALGMRIERLEQGVAKDARKMNAVRPFWNAYLTYVKRHSVTRIMDPEVTKFRWMIEELRVSLFAQELGTGGPISVKRLEGQWDRINREKLF
jgi:ATP-dependent helicase HrpA